MMLTIILILLALIVWCDAKIFKKYYEDLFKECFAVSARFMIILTALSTLILSFSDNREQLFPALIFVTLLPLYLIRRHRFLKKIEVTGTPFQVNALMPLNQILLSDCYGVVLKFFFSLLTSTAVVKGVVMIYPKFASELGELVLATVISSVLMLMFIVRAARPFPGKNFWAKMGVLLNGHSFSKIIVMPSLLGLGFACISTLILVLRKVQPKTPLGDMIETTNSMGVVLIFLAAAVLIAPLIEEIIFRGYLFHVISQVRGKTFAIYFISLSFAFFHVGQYWGDWQAIMMITLLGFTLTYMRAHWGTTVPSIVMHYVYNASITLLPFIIMTEKGA